MFQVVGDCAIEACSLLYMYPTLGVPNPQAIGHNQDLSWSVPGHGSGRCVCVHVHIPSYVTSGQLHACSLHLCKWQACGHACLPATSTEPSPPLNTVCKDGKLGQLCSTWISLPLSSRGSVACFWLPFWLFWYCSVWGIELQKRDKPSEEASKNWWECWQARSDPWTRITLFLIQNIGFPELSPMPLLPASFFSTLAL